jgi:hypothetical protein
MCVIIINKQLWTFGMTRFFIFLGFLLLFNFYVKAEDVPDYSVNLYAGEVPKNAYLLGTGFAVTDDGTYSTAQHVVTGCKTTYVKYFGKWVKADFIKRHKNSDVALVHISKKTYPIRISLEDGQAQIVKILGFNKSSNDQFFEKTATYLITTYFKVSGLFHVSTMSDIWKIDDEEQKKNHIKGKYEGISGGPVLDSDNYVAGVFVAENATEPLIVTMLPNDITDLLDNKQLINNQKSSSIVKTEKDMLNKSSITQIMCK